MPDDPGVSSDISEPGEKGHRRLPAQFRSHLFAPEGFNHFVPWSQHIWDSRGLKSKLIKMYVCIL